jgi:hypothetical protein
MTSPAARHRDGSTNTAPPRRPPESHVPADECIFVEVDQVPVGGEPAMSRNIGEEDFDDVPIEFD